MACAFVPVANASRASVGAKVREIHEWLRREHNLAIRFGLRL